MNLEPAISADGKRLFFMSNRPAPDDPEARRKQDLWVSERGERDWDEPRNLGSPVNTEAGEYFPSPARSGALYFTRERGGGDESDGIYRSRWVDGRYTELERLPPQVNSGSARFNAFVDPDERYLIVPIQGRNDTVGGVDYYIVFRNDDDSWSEPVNLGPLVNTAGSGEYSASLSPEGQYLFFMSSRGLPDGARPARLTTRWLREMHGKPQNGNPDIYWAQRAQALRSSNTLLTALPGVARDALDRTRMAGTSGVLDWPASHARPDDLALPQFGPAHSQPRRGTSTCSHSERYSYWPRRWSR